MELVPSEVQILDTLPDFDQWLEPRHRPGTRRLYGQILRRFARWLQATYPAIPATVRQIGIRAAALCQVSRRMLHYQYRQPTRDQTVIHLMHELVVRYPRYGYRRIHAVLQRQGYRINRKRVHRLWQQLGFQRPRRTKRQRRAGISPHPPRPTQINTVWAVDFLYDQTASGQPLKILTVVDEYSREALTIRVQRCMTSRDVHHALNDLVQQRGQPTMLRSDNGSEFVAQTLHMWSAEQGIQPVPIAPGKPWQNGVNERFHGTLRDECLNQEVWTSVEEAQVIIERWRQQYNGERPHSSLDYRTPTEYRNLSHDMD